MKPFLGLLLVLAAILAATTTILGSWGELFAVLGEV